MELLKLPRYDLREAAFRKYEMLIARGCRETFTVNPTIDMPQPMNSHTFAVRFRDAVLGYQRYHYKSGLIPKAAQPHLIKVHELQSGLVQVESPSTGIDITNLHVSKHKKDIQYVIEQQLEGGLYHGQGILVNYSTTDERDWVMAEAFRISGSVNAALDMPETKQVELY